MQGSAFACKGALSHVEESCSWILGVHAAGEHWVFCRGICCWYAAGAPGLPGQAKAHVQTALACSAASAAVGFAAQGFPSWQVLLVDLRCHGESTQMQQRPPRPHSVESAAEDVLKLLGQLKLFPEVLVGHSFGGKVVMSMVDQFGRLGSRLPRPVQARPGSLCSLFASICNISDKSLVTWTCVCFLCMVPGRIVKLKDRQGEVEGL